MSSVEAPIYVEQIGDVKDFDYCRKVLYWQGFWQDANEPAEPDLEFYLKYFTPRLAHLLANHRLLRLALKLYRRFNPLFIIFSLGTRVFLLAPMSMYAYWSDSFAVASNFFAIILDGVQLSAAFAYFFNYKIANSFFEEMDMMLGPGQMGNDEQRIMYDKTRKLCNKIITHILIPFVFCVGVGLTLSFGAVLLPERRFPIREWFPWDTTCSPAFEITLFIRYIQTINVAIMTGTVVSVLSISLILPLSNYKILNNKLENVRPISIERIKARKLKESVRSAEETVVTIEFEHSQQVHTPGPALRGDRLRAGPAAALNARRVDDLALLRPLYEAYPIGFSSGRDEMSLEGVFQGHRHRAGPAAALNARRVDDLALLRSLYEAYPIGFSSGRDEMPLEGVFQGHRHRAGNAVLNARRDDDLAMLRPIFDEVIRNSVSVSGMMEMPLDDLFQYDDGYPKKKLECIASADIHTEMRIVLMEGIQIHVKLIRYVGLFARFYNVGLIAMFIGNTMAMGVAALLWTQKDSDEQMNLLFVWLLSFCIEITLVYLIVNNGMQLIADQVNCISPQHDAVCESMYNSDWTGASPSFKKAMLVIMSRANVPLEIKPTGMDPLSRHNFAQVMNSAYKMVNSLNTIVN